jgi:SNF2 family DNA or RNA helicase
MGLGKTIQVISALTAAFGKTGDERDARRMRKMRQQPENFWYPIVLLICPGSLLSNWQAELQRWGWWHIYAFHGSSEDKQSAMEAAKNGRAEIVITTYDTYRLNKDLMNMISWDCVIADECHRIKERKAEITKAMNEVNALCRIGLTGTAIQNNYDELWNLLNWTNPGRFGSLESWRKSIGIPLKTGQSHEATTVELARGRKIARQLVQNVLPNYFLRRMKSLIADQLPKKSDRVVFCPLTAEQAQAYETLVGSETVESVARATEVCDCGRIPSKKRGWCCYKYLSNGDIWQMHVFPAMQTLQKLANHLALLIPSEDGSPEQQMKDYEKLEMAVPHKAKELFATQASIRHLSNVNFCGKWRILRKLLDFWYKSRRFERS